MSIRRSKLSTLAFASSAIALSLAASTGFAQTAGSTDKAPDAKNVTPAPRTGNPMKDALLRMQKPLTVELNDSKLEDVFGYIARETGADLEVMWKNDIDDGLDKEQTITVAAKNMPAIDFLEKIFERFEGGTKKHSWQLADNGAVQIGSKSRLNKFKRIEIYDINDLLFVLPLYDNAPQIDLNSVLQSSKGGSAQSPFKERANQTRKEQEVKSKDDRAKDLQELLTSTIENEEWLDGGGENTIRYYQGSFIVNAADYMHRALNGYKWWPSFKTSGGTSGVKRYVSLTPDTSIAKADVPFRTVSVNEPR